MSRAWSGRPLFSLSGRAVGASGHTCTPLASKAGAGCSAGHALPSRHSQHLAGRPAPSAHGLHSAGIVQSGGCSQCTSCSQCRNCKLKARPPRRRGGKAHPHPEVEWARRKGAAVLRLWRERTGGSRGHGWQILATAVQLWPGGWTERKAIPLPCEGDGTGSESELPPTLRWRRIPPPCRGNGLHVNPRLLCGGGGKPFL
jgi:hypothetical protein